MFLSFIDNLRINSELWKRLQSNSELFSYFVNISVYYIK
jgi:hypothetical protein